MWFHAAIFWVLWINISADGLRPSKGKVWAVVEAPAPLNMSQLHSFLGLVKYYDKFLPNISSILATLYRLLEQNTAWAWSSEQQRVFQAVNSHLTSPFLLVHFDPNRELVLVCDASPHGIGAVLSQWMDDSWEKPIAFASHSLAPAEKRYAQLNKEELAVIFGVKKFHRYLYGHHFKVVSDHKPLKHLLWILFSSYSGVAYNYTIVYWPGSEHTNAYFLSR